MSSQEILVWAWDETNQEWVKVAVTAAGYLKVKSA